MHDHDHHHAHGHHHHHEHEATGSQASLSETDKLLKIVEHWIAHNTEHAKSYRDWADRARRAGHEQVYLILEEVATGSQALNENLERIVALLNDVPSSR